MKKKIYYNMKAKSIKKYSSLVSTSLVNDFVENIFPIIGKSFHLLTSEINSLEAQRWRKEVLGIDSYDVVDDGEDEVKENEFKDEDHPSKSDSTKPDDIKLTQMIQFKDKNEDHQSMLRNLVSEKQGDIQKLCQLQIRKLMTELHSGGNCRFQPACKYDWEVICGKYLENQFNECGLDFNFNRLILRDVTKVSNKFLRTRFENVVNSLCLHIDKTSERSSKNNNKSSKRKKKKKSKKGSELRKNKEECGKKNDSKYQLYEEERFQEYIKYFLKSFESQQEAILFCQVFIMSHYAFDLFDCFPFNLILLLIEWVWKL